MFERCELALGYANSQERGRLLASVPADELTDSDCGSRSSDLFLRHDGVLRRLVRSGSMDRLFDAVWIAVLPFFAVLLICWCVACACKDGVL